MSGRILSGKVSAPAANQEITSQEVERGLLRLRRVFFWASRVLFIAAVTITLLVAAVVLGMMLAFALPSISVTADGDLSNLVLALIAFPVLVALPWILTLFFRAITRGESPFGIYAVRLLLILSFTYLVDVIVSAFPTGSLVVSVNVSGWIFGYSFSATESVFDIGSAGACVAFASLALIFKYGQMLQAVSDSTV